jgi:hypothetical protein
MTPLRRSLGWVALAVLVLLPAATATVVLAQTVRP